MQYIVKIQTSEISSAGTDSSFYYTFIGSKGKTAEHYADAVGNDREYGNVDTWIFNDNADIGFFRCISIRMEGTDGWHFKDVSLKNYR